MKPRLVIGLGNPLVPEDAVGWHVAERLARDARLPDDTEVICGGTDLLRWAGRMEGRKQVILVDALAGAEEIEILTDFEGLDDRQTNAHHLSAVQAVRLLRAAVPSLQEVRFTLVAVAGPADIGAVLDRILFLAIALPVPAAEPGDSI